MKYFNKNIIFLIVLWGIPYSFTFFSKTVELRFQVWKGFTPDFALNTFREKVWNDYNIHLKFKIFYTYKEDEIIEAIDNNRVDLLSLSHYLFRDPRHKYYASDKLHAIDTSKLDNYKFVIPVFRNLDFLWKNKKVYGIPLENSSYRLIYNKDKIKKIKNRSWSLLWDPRYIKKYSVSRDYFETNIYITALAVGLKGKDIFNHKLLEKHKDFREKLKELAQNARRYWGDLEKPEDINGSIIATAFGNFNHLLKDSWDFVIPKEGVPGSMDFFAISKKIESDPLKLRIAYEWINFSISKYYQRKVIMEGNHEMPVIMKFRYPLSDYERKRFHMDDLGYYKKERFLWPARSVQRIRSYKRMWEEAMSKK